MLNQYTNSHSRTQVKLRLAKFNFTVSSIDKLQIYFFHILHVLFQQYYLLTSIHYINIKIPSQFIILVFAAMKILVTLFLICIATSFQIQSNVPGQANGYDLQNSKIYVAYGILSYCPKKCLQDWSCKFSENYPKLVNVTHVNNDITLAAAYIGYEPKSKTVIISWRGSSNAQNWIEDFTFQMEPFSGCNKCYIHVGFNQDYHLNAKKINDHLQVLIKSYQVSKIIVTGHSLGAALASINAVHIVMSGVKIPVQVYNFGSPRYGNENLAQFTKLLIPNHYRLVHHKDIVPHAPPSVQYKHAAYQIFFNQGMTQYVVCNDSGEDPKCSNQYFPDYSIKDHNFYFVALQTVKC